MDTWWLRLCDSVWNDPCRATIYKPLPNNTTKSRSIEHWGQIQRIESMLKLETTYLQLYTILCGAWSKCCMSSGCHYWDYYPGALFLSRVTMTYLKIGHPWISSTDAGSSNGCRDQITYHDTINGGRVTCPFLEWTEDVFIKYSRYEDANRQEQ